MIRTAIVGLGWWGKTLVNSVQDKSGLMRFVAAHTRTRSKVEDFCREKQLVFHESLDALLRDPAIDAVVYAAEHRDRSEQAQKTAAAGKRPGTPTAGPNHRASGWSGRRLASA